MEIIGKENIERLLTTNPMVLLYFYNDNCAPCVSLRPKVARMAEEDFPQLTMGFINASQNSDVTAGYSIFSSPTLLLFIDNKETLRESKYVSVEDLRGKIGRYYELYFS